VPTAFFFLPAKNSSITFLGIKAIWKVTSSKSLAKQKQEKIIILKKSHTLKTVSQHSHCWK
jgi:hypothetical protein